MPGDKSFPKNRVHDEKEAWNAAHTEQLLRDMGRGKGVNRKDTLVLDRFARKAGQKVINAEKEKKSFVGRENVKGFDIIVEWDKEQEAYVMKLSQSIVALGKHHGLEIKIGTNPDTAKWIFKYACERAQKDTDLASIHRNTMSHLMNLS